MTVFSERRNNYFDDRRLWWAVVASLLLHLLLLAVLLAEPWTWRRQPPPPQEISMVFPEAPKPPPPKAAEAPKPPQQPVPQLPEPSVPQLQRAPVAEQSQAPPAPGSKARPRPPADEGARPAPPKPEASGPAPKAELKLPAKPQKAAEAGHRQQGAGTAAGPAGETMTQSESDFFLGQIVAAWVIDFDAPKFRNIVISGAYQVLPNGMIGPPFGKNDPWDMEAMVNNWDEIATLPNAADYRTAIETFLRAMRLAQPFKMPPGARGYPKILTLNFRIGDL